MDAKHILVLGLKGSVLAYHRDTGQLLWSTHLKSNGFVSVVTDLTRVYAHTHGELFCLDLFTGNGVWNDPLKGWGFDLASMALPGAQPLSPSTTFQKLQQDQAAAQSTAMPSS
jgi:outer membrane protein assembly factor BamB